ncbi:hypothetical protein Nans01_43070 [Nocardiopsis ansamitocini]|uniref:MYXO-CTERM domain-containing protein n=1 Tax=Nocardiopsis ansamitocini TaxID=1670832 RepID=A0A9W6PAH3_9ACTN|nr:hypothetical protein Nans01_43070 [Nocardiopsis ansamitocini]
MLVLLHLLCALCLTSAAHAAVQPAPVPADVAVAASVAAPVDVDAHTLCPSAAGVDQRTGPSPLLLLLGLAVVTVVWLAAPRLRRSRRRVLPGAAPRPLLPFIALGVLRV